MKTYKQLCDNITELFQQAIEMDVDDLSNRVKSSVNEKIELSRSTDDEKARLRKAIEWAHVYIARLKEGKEPDYDRIRVGGKFYGTKNEDVARELVGIAKELMGK